MRDLGPPVSFYVLKRGADVYASDGKRVGEVVEVRADESADIFDAIVIQRLPLAGRRHLVNADQVDEIYERGVVLTLDSDAVESLPEG